MRNLQRGLTLVEAIIMILIIEMLVGWFIVKVLIMGNFWFVEAGVLRKIKLSNLEATSILDSTRNVYEDSVVLVTVNNKKVWYCVDSDILFNYEIKECPVK